MARVRAQAMAECRRRMAGQLRMARVHAGAMKPFKHLTRGHDPDEGDEQ